MFCSEASVFRYEGNQEPQMAKPYIKQEGIKALYNFRRTGLGKNDFNLKRKLTAQDIFFSMYSV